MAETEATARTAKFSELVGGDIFFATHPTERTQQKFVKLAQEITGWGNAVCLSHGVLSGYTILFKDRDVEVEILKRPWEID